MNADEAGTETVVLNEMQAFEGVLDLSQGDITFSEQGGNLVISHYQKEADSTESTLKTIPGQSYETVYTIVTSEENTAHLLKINTSAAQDVKLVVKGIHLQASETAAQDAAPIQINGSSACSCIWKERMRFRFRKRNQKLRRGLVWLRRHRLP